MKQRIINKKLKKDIQLNLWLNQVINSIEVIVNSYPKINDNDLEMSRFKLVLSLIDYEMNQINKIAVQKYHIKYNQSYKYYDYGRNILKDGHYINW